MWKLGEKKTKTGVKVVVVYGGRKFPVGTVSVQWRQNLNVPF